MSRSLAFLVLILATVAPTAAAQSIFATEGLGVPVAPVDARARALGGIGVGLLGRNPSLVNPASVSGFPFRGVTAAFQASDRSFDVDGASGDVGSARFPLLHVIYPLDEKLTFSVGYGGFLDQSWSAFAERVEVIGADTFNVRDAIDHSGGIVRVQVGAAYALSRSFAVGLAGGLLTGQLDRTVSRSFANDDSVSISPFRQDLTWSERAPFISGGLRWDPARILRVEGSVTWNGTLEGSGEGDAIDFDVDLPLQLAGGIGAVLSPRLNAVIAARWDGWSSAGDAGFGGRRARDAWQIGGGLEWGTLQSATRSFPLRLGFQYGTFPFEFEGEQPREWVASLGLGGNFAGTQFGPRATIDAAIERGGRNVDSSALSEDFWRFTVSLSLFGQ